MINKRRGDRELTLNGKALALRPSFEALVFFEESSNKSVVKCYADILNGNLMVRDMVHLIYAGYSAHPDNKDKPLSTDTISESVMKDGAVSIAVQGMDEEGNSLSVLGEFVQNLAYGEKSIAFAEKEGEPAPTVKKRPRKTLSKPT